MSVEILLAAGAGFLLDLLLGDPRWLPHPVVAIGKVISWGERGLRRLLPATAAGERLGGCLLVCLVLAVTGGVSWGLLALAARIHRYLALALAVTLTGCAAGAAFTAEVPSAAPATPSPTAAETTLAVADRMEGKGMAVRQA